MFFAAQIKSHVQSAPRRYFVTMLLRLIATFLLPLCISAAQFPIKSNAKISVLVFISTDCPISNKLAPEIERLSHKFSTNDVAFTIVYPNASDTDDKIARHRRDYRLTGNFLSDPKHELIKAAGATITPEAAVFDTNRALAYRGRINDRFLALGKDRSRANHHDLEDAITALLAGKKPKDARTEAVGCFIQN